MPRFAAILATLLVLLPCAYAAEFPPALPDGAEKLVDASDALITQPAGTTPLRDGVTIAKTAPEVTFVWLPGQDYAGKPWSNWSDGAAVGMKYYSAIGDHHSPKGSGRLYEFDAETGTVRQLVDTKALLEPTLHEDENYLPGKIHSRICPAPDGWLYYSTHRGSPRTTSDQYGYRGDWILRTWPDPDPEKAKTEVVAAYPVPKHCMPASVLDPKRMVYYAGSACGKDAPEQAIQFLAYDVANHKTLTLVPGGFDRYVIFSRSTGRLYWQPRGAKGEPEPKGVKYDPKTNRITPCPAAPHVRSCTRETKDGIVYGVSGRSCTLWAFNTRTETLAELGEGAVARQTYTTSMDMDPSERYVYYVPGAHGGGNRDGTPVVQFDVKTKTRKVIAFMNALAPKVGGDFLGTFSTALSDDGTVLFVTWNMGRPKWDSCAVTAIRIPESERTP